MFVFFVCSQQVSRGAFGSRLSAPCRAVRCRCLPRLILTSDSGSTSWTWENTRMCSKSSKELRWAMDNSTVSAPSSNRGLPSFPPLTYYCFPFWFTSVFLAEMSVFFTVTLDLRGMSKNPGFTWKSKSQAKLTGHFSPVIPSFADRGLSCRLHVEAPRGESGNV